MNRRIYRVNQALREVVSEAIETELKDPRLGFVTVTAVRVTPDLRDARVFVSVLGEEDERETSIAALQAAGGMFQARVAQRLRMKRTPRLEFVHDDTTDRAMYLNELIAREEEELEARGAGSGERPDDQAEGPAGQHADDPAEREQ